MTRSALLGILAASIGALAVACSETEGELEDGASPSTSSPGTDPAPSEGGTRADSAPQTANDAGSGIDSSAADSSPPKPKSAFDGAPGFLSQAGMSARQGGHNFNANTPKTNPAGRACLNCHGGGGAPAFAAAGTIYDGAKPAASVEVRAFGADGKAYSAYTDADGNFFIRANTQLTLPALVGVRNATSTRVMGSAAAKGNCNECHSTAGGAGNIVVNP